RGSAERVAQRRALDAERIDVPGGAPHVGDVDVQDGRGSLERDKRRLHVRLATEQAAFLRRRGDEEDGAAGGWGERGEGLRRRQDGGHTRGVILRAVVDRVAVHVGPVPLVIPEGGEEDGLTPEPGIASGAL